MAYVLIVDDDELIAEIVTDVLIGVGHACGWVTSAEEAWALLAGGKHPHLVLLDQGLPGMSGIALLRKFRASADFYDLPVIMFTAMTGRNDEARAIFDGAQDFISKPFNTGVLLSRIEGFFARRYAEKGHKPVERRLAESAGLVSAEPSAVRRVI